MQCFNHPARRGGLFRGWPVCLIALSALGLPVSGWTQGWYGPPLWQPPYYQTTRAVSVRQVTRPDAFIVIVELRGVAPDKVRLGISGRALLVQSGHTQSAPGSYVSVRQFRKRVALPPDADLARLSVQHTPSGLQVWIPRRR